MKERIRLVLSQAIGVAPDLPNWNNCTNLFSIAEIDSICMVNIISGLEREFGIEIDEGKLTLGIFQSIDSLTLYLSKQMEMEF